MGYEAGLVFYLVPAFLDSIISGRKQEFGKENFVLANFSLIFCLKAAT